MSNRLAAELGNKLKQGALGTTFRLRDVYLRGWAGLDTPEAARTALAVLEDAGWVRRVDAKCGAAENGCPSTKPTEPSKPQAAVTTTSPARESHSLSPVPTGLRTVQCRFAGGASRMTIARHNLSGTNRFGETAAEFPYCLVNLAAWKECPFDLHVARWFRSKEGAASHAEGGTAAQVEKLPASKLWTGEFAGGLQVELRWEQGGRWLMWVNP